jgi:hypothetical protein
MSSLWQRASSLTRVRHSPIKRSLQCTVLSTPGDDEYPYDHATGYVPQTEMFMNHLTSREHLIFHAINRMSYEWTTDQCYMRVEEVSGSRSVYIYIYMYIYIYIYTYIYIYKTAVSLVGIHIFFCGMMSAWLPKLIAIRNDHVAYV